VEAEGRIAERARDGFHRGVMTGLVGMALAGMTKGRFTSAASPSRCRPSREYYRGRFRPTKCGGSSHECRPKARARTTL
jgi:electron-transferring-flavoprotein dehydrogenase